jgi:hypothetical protein
MPKEQSLLNKFYKIKSSKEMTEEVKEESKKA